MVSFLHSTAAVITLAIMARPDFQEEAEVACMVTVAMVVCKGETSMGAEEDIVEALLEASVVHSVVAVEAGRFAAKRPHPNREKAKAWSF